MHLIQFSSSISDSWTSWCSWNKLHSQLVFIQWYCDYCIDFVILSSTALVCLVSNTDHWQSLWFLILDKNDQQTSARPNITSYKYFPTLATLYTSIYHGVDDRKVAQNSIKTVSKMAKPRFHVFLLPPTNQEWPWVLVDCPQVTYDLVHGGPWLDRRVAWCRLDQSGLGICF